MITLCKCQQCWLSMVCERGIKCAFVLSCVVKYSGTTASIYLYHLIRWIMWIESGSCEMLTHVNMRHHPCGGESLDGPVCSCVYRNYRRFQHPYIYIIRFCIPNQQANMKPVSQPRICYIAFKNVMVKIIFLGKSDTDEFEV